ncbi:hypothetical protein Syun_021569 [Stephania yunnanensis]|uniref:Uncharacterized protein n=1 Tax=Stephania yunnanensis TaxID=152371 RepID=A0AAP0NP94_9MAGN
MHRGLVFDLDEKGSDGVRDSSTILFGSRFRFEETQLPESIACGRVVLSVLTCSVEQGNSGVLYQIGFEETSTYLHPLDLASINFIENLNAA